MQKKRKPEGSRFVVARNLRTLRLAQGLSQEELADLAGLHRTYVSSVERFERNATLDTLDKLSTALKIEPSELLVRRDETSS